MTEENSIWKQANVKQIFKESSLVFIPKDCYMITPDNITSNDYEIYYKGEKINNIYGIIKYGYNFIINNEEKRTIITNWRKELEK